MSKAWKEVQFYSKMVFVVSLMCKMTFFGMTMNEVVRMPHLRKNESVSEGSLDKLSDDIKMI
jgi:hypothetical protein